MPTATPDPPPLGAWIDIAGSSAYVAPAEGGAAAGLLLLAGASGIDGGIAAWCDRFARDGYCVLAAAADAAVAPALDLLRRRVKAEAGIGAVALGAAAAPALALAERGALAAVAIHGLAPDIAAALARNTCPVAIHLAAPDLEPGAGPAALRALVHTMPLLRLYEYPGCGERFFDRLAPAFEPHAASLAHTRTLGTLRPAIGPHYDLARLLYEHLRQEFVTHDADATMETMVDTPYVNHVPTLTGGVGHDMLKRFYKYHFIPKLPQQRRNVYLSETVGADTVVLEFVTTFIHDTEIDYLLPGIPPTGKQVEIPTVVIAKFQGDKLYHEHIYWDQASVLAQLGLIYPAELPIAGAAEARKMLDQSLPANELMTNWSTSADKPI
jgi:carboxymethylenebutenolidase